MAPIRNGKTKGKRTSTRRRARPQGTANGGNANKGNPSQMPLAIINHHAEENQPPTSLIGPVEQFKKKLNLLNSIPRGKIFSTLLPFFLLSFIVFGYKGNHLFKFILPPNAHEMCYPPSKKTKKVKRPRLSPKDELDDEAIELGVPHYKYVDELMHEDVANVADSFNVQLVSKKIGTSRLYVPIDFSHPVMCSSIGVWAIKIGASEWDVNMNCTSLKIAENRMRSGWHEFCLDNKIAENDSITFEVKLDSPRALYATIKREITMVPIRNGKTKGKRSSTRRRSRPQGNTNEANAKKGNPSQMPLAIINHHAEENQPPTSLIGLVEQFKKKLNLLNSIPRGNIFSTLLPFFLLSFIVFGYKGNHLFKFILPPNAQEMCYPPSKKTKKVKRPRLSPKDELDDEAIELGVPHYRNVYELMHEEVANVADSINVQLVSKKLGTSRLCVPIDFSHPVMCSSIGIWAVKIGASEWDVNMNCTSPKIAENRMRSGWHEFCLDNKIAENDSITFEVKLDSPRALYATIKREVKS